MLFIIRTTLEGECFGSAPAKNGHDHHYYNCIKFKTILFTNLKTDGFQKIDDFCIKKGFLVLIKKPYGTLFYIHNGRMSKFHLQINVAKI